MTTLQIELIAGAGVGRMWLDGVELPEALRQAISLEIERRYMPSEGRATLSVEIDLDHVEYVWQTATAEEARDGAGGRDERG